MAGRGACPIAGLMSRRYAERQVDKVLNGDIDAFIKTYLMQKTSGILGQASAADAEE